MSRKSRSRKSRSIKVRTGDCVARSLTKLKDWQLKVVNYMKDNDGLLVCHSTGSGKTLTAVTVSQCFLDKDINNKVIFVGPPGLISNFRKQLFEVYGAEDEDRYEYYSFDKFFRQEKTNSEVACGKNTLLIVDEAHNLRNPKTEVIQDIEKLTRSNAILKCAMKAGKRLLLTATPFVNNLEDFIPIINMIYGKRILGTKKQVKQGLAESYIDVEVLKKLLKNKIHIVDSKDDEFFPKKFVYHIKVPMSNEYFRIYNDVISAELEEDSLFANPMKFYNGHRRAVNKAGDEYFGNKIQKMLTLIKDQKAVVFTNWLEYGIDPVEKVLKENGKTFNSITGATNKKYRQDIVDSFNNNEFQILVISKAGSEGIDLKEVRNLVVLDPVWNYAGLEQIMGRVARYKSHINLPKSQRNVNIYLLVSTEPYAKSWEVAKDEEAVSGDRILYNIIGKKKILNEKLTEILVKECSL